DRLDRDRPGQRHVRAHRRLSRTSAQFHPPKPNELLIATRASVGRDSSRYALRSAGSSRVTFAPAGSSRCRSASRQTTASSAPAAPSAWPCAPLVELTGTASPKTACTAASSAASLLGVAVPCRFT